MAAGPCVLTGSARPHSVRERSRPEGDSANESARRTSMMQTFDRAGGVDIGKAIA